MGSFSFCRSYLLKGIFHGNIIMGPCSVILCVLNLLIYSIVLIILSILIVCYTFVILGIWSLPSQNVIGALEFLNLIYHRHRSTVVPGTWTPLKSVYMCVCVCMYEYMNIMNILRRWVRGRSPVVGPEFASKAYLTLNFTFFHYPKYSSLCFRVNMYSIHSYCETNAIDRWWLSLQTQFSRQYQI